MFQIRFTSIVTLLAVVTCSAQSSMPEKKCLPRPKNIILMIGDGMGFNHLQAANFYQGTDHQPYEKFPVRLAMAHYPAKAGSYNDSEPGANFWATGYNTVAAWTDTEYLRKDYTESAAAATAMATGVKTYNNAIGMGVDHDTLVNLVQWAKDLGKAAGVVTSVPFSHATPAGFVAHSVSRNDYPGIAREMLLDSRCDVIMGCGDPMFDNDAKPTGNPWKSSKYVGDSIFWVEFLKGSGTRTTFPVKGVARTVADIDGDGKPDPWHVVRDAGSFRDLGHGTTPKRVLGCPMVYSTLQKSRSLENGKATDSLPFTVPFNRGIPSLSEMAAGALNVLDNNPAGFFVMIEGGAIDWASHDNEKGRLIEEMTGFNEAVNQVIDWVSKNSNWEETLVIVTGDHETGLLWGEKPFAPLQSKGKGALPVMKFYSKDHTNSLIPFFAKGPGSELFRAYADERDSFRGPYIQNSEIAQLIHFLWFK